MDSMLRVEASALCGTDPHGEGISGMTWQGEPCSPPAVGEAARRALDTLKRR